MHQSDFLINAFESKILRPAFLNIHIDKPSFGKKYSLFISLRISHPVLQLFSKQVVLTMLVINVNTRHPVTANAIFLPTCTSINSLGQKFSEQEMHSFLRGVFLESLRTKI